MADQIEGRQSFGHPGRMVVLRWHEPDAMSDPDVRRQRRSGGEEHLWRRRVGVFLQKMVLRRPHVLDSQLVRQDRLLEGFVKGALFGPLVPRPWKLNFEKYPEPHGCSTSYRSSTTARVPPCRPIPRRPARSTPRYKSSSTSFILKRPCRRQGGSLAPASPQASAFVRRNLRLSQAHRVGIRIDPDHRGLGVVVPDRGRGNLVDRDAKTSVLLRDETEDAASLVPLGQHLGRDR